MRIAAPMPVRYRWFLLALLLVLSIEFIVAHAQVRTKEGGVPVTMVGEERAPRQRSAPAPAAQRFSFGLIGNLPAAPNDEAHLKRIIDAIDASDVRFSVNAGGIRGMAGACTDEQFEGRKSLLDSGRKSLFVVPGTYDWVDCEETIGGGYDAGERMSRVRELFFDGDFSLGQEKLKLTRESDLAKFRGYPENVRWQSGNILFVGLNLPGRNNNFRLAAGRNGEFEDRSIANSVWMERAFHLATQQRLPGIVIVVHADPRFDLPGQRAGAAGRNRDGYREFKEQLRDLTAAYKGQVLLLHNESHRLRHDQPLRDGRGRVLPNFTRVDAMGPRNTSEWVRITVNPRSPRLFQVGLRRAG